jgi:hypothetical protein
LRDVGGHVDRVAATLAELVGQARAAGTVLTG